MNDTAPALTFDPDCHQYFINGQPCGSVTGILQDLGLKNSYFGPEGDWYARRGTIVHRGCELLDAKNLKWDSVDSRIEPYLRAWMKFKVENSVEILECEKRVFSAQYWYAGTLDRLIRVDGDTETTILIDIKTGQPDPGDRYQTAGYSIARFDNPYEVKRWCVYLRDTGKYKIVVHPDRQDFNVFMAACTVYNAKEKRI